MPFWKLFVILWFFFFFCFCVGVGVGFVVVIVVVVIAVIIIVVICYLFPSLSLSPHLLPFQPRNFAEPAVEEFSVKMTQSNCLGSGSFGSVYKAKLGPLDVAAKTLWMLNTPEVLFLFLFIFMLFRRGEKFYKFCSIKNVYLKIYFFLFFYYTDVWVIPRNRRI